MAKELPYFQFEPAEYLTKDVSFCSLSAQGLFINLCAYYWQRGCKLSKSQLLRRLNHAKELDELIHEDVVKLDGEDISISFLDDQWAKALRLSNINSINGQKGGRPPNKTQSKPKENPIESETKGKRKEEIKKEDKNVIPTLEEFTSYCLDQKSNLLNESIRFKYNQWIENGWRDGYDKPIKSWKAKANGIIPHLKINTNFDDKKYKLDKTNSAHF